MRVKSFKNATTLSFTLTALLSASVAFANCVSTQARYAPERKICSSKAYLKEFKSKILEGVNESLSERIRKQKIRCNTRRVIANCQIYVFNKYEESLASCPPEFQISARDERDARKLLNANCD